MYLGKTAEIWKTPRYLWRTSTGVAGGAISCT